jgi:hypothetical protein
MGEALLLLATNFVYGAYHAIQPGHGKTIAAAYIVGARGRPVDAWILGIFVTLSHTSGIVLVGVLASLGLPGLGSHRIEAWLAVATGVLVILLGLWSLWTQRQLFQVAGCSIALTNTTTMRRAACLARTRTATCSIIMITPGSMLMVTITHTLIRMAMLTTIRTRKASRPAITHTGGDSSTPTIWRS